MNTPLIGIALCTYEPNIDLFKTQIESIRNQSQQNFVCLISDDNSSSHIQQQIQNILADDSRFIFRSNESNLGVTLNFEKAIDDVLKYEPLYVALSDQDDYWYTRKLQSQIDFLLESGAKVVSCDLAIVDIHNNVIRNSLRKVPRRSDFGSLLAANDVAGASILMTNEFSRYVTPFPVSKTRLFHDHWIALLAANMGVLRLDSRVLYSFVQHGLNDSGDRRQNDWDSFARLFKFSFSLSALQSFLDERISYINAIQSRSSAKTTLNKISIWKLFKLISSPSIAGDRKLGFIYVYRLRRKFGEFQEMFIKGE